MAGATTQTLTPGTILRHSADGSATLYQPAADTDTARGSTFIEAHDEMVAGDVLYLAAGGYLLPAGDIGSPTNDWGLEREDLDGASMTIAVASPATSGVNIWYVEATIYCAAAVLAGFGLLPVALIRFRAKVDVGTSSPAMTMTIGAEYADGQQRSPLDIAGD